MAPMSAFGGKADIVFRSAECLFLTQSGHGISGTSLRNGPFLPIRGRASADASLATIWLVRDGRCAFSQPNCELAEHDEDRDQEDQRKATANDPDCNLDRKWICDADGVAKKYLLAATVRRNAAGVTRMAAKSFGGALPIRP
jgi:hypothetical protein